MVRHSMLYAPCITQHLNNDQHVAIVGDHPVYTRGKQQWFYPENFKNVVWLLGCFHIEMAWISLQGKWFEDSGWGTSLHRTGLTTIGREERLLTKSFAKKVVTAIELL